MKRTFLLLLIFVLPLLTGCEEDVNKPTIEIETGFPADRDKEFDRGSAVSFPELNGQLTDNLELLGRIWGFLKYHHPEVGKGNYNWDYELFRVLPEYLKATNNTERDRILLDWINKYGEIPACKTCRETNPDAYIKPDHLWIENGAMNNTLKAKLKDIYQNRHQGDHYYIQIQKGLLYPLQFLHEREYSYMDFPDTGFRLLALYRYWNMIQYFCPNKYLTDKNWNDILQEYIPLFISVTNRLEYELVVLQLIGEINDSHAAGGLKGFDRVEESKGNNYAPFRVWFIEGKLVVTDYYNPEYKALSGLEIGSIITHINGEAVESIVDAMKKYYSASNKAAGLRDMSFDLLLRSKNNSVTINYESPGQSGQKDLHLFDAHSLNRYYGFKVSPNDQCFKFLDRNIGYITLAAPMKDDDVESIKNAFQHAKGIIIDIRNYPYSESSYFALFSYNVSSSTTFVKFSYGNVDNPGEFFFNEDQSIFPGNVTYQGKLIVLVNEITQSQAEWATMAFRACDNSTIIGSTTAGADGNVSYIELPGGLKTRISGLGVYYPDGTETQRIGIVPDVWVEPTIEGIRQGRDELLEMAIKLINEE